ncbi:MAG: glycosyltransferase family 39 protein [Candidatus Aadella gelida]|nr:glycosyltransferase family 39 protein [Candidatus Aadella gelida]
MLRKYRYLIILIVISSSILLFRLGDMALTDPDETFYAQTAKEMVAADEWTTPLIFGEPQFEKPIFYYWLIIISYKMFGINEFAARFPSVLFGIMGVIGIFFMGRLMFSERCGFISGLILATCVEYVVVSRGCVTDIVLTTAILLCLLFFLLGWTRTKTGYYLIAAVFAAIAVLTKGPIGLFIPVVIISSFILTVRDWRAVRKIPFFRCVFLFLIIAMPWYIIVTRMHGEAFLGEFFGFHNIVRFLEPEHRIGTSPWFYIPVVMGGFFPWSFFLPVGFWIMIREPKDASETKGYRAFLLAWFISIFLFFSISRTKLVTYILPLFPVMAIIVGRLWDKFLSGGQGSGALEKKIKISHFALTISSILMSVGVSLFVKQRYPEAFMGTVISAAVFMSGTIIAFIMLLKGKKIKALYVGAASVVVIIVPLTLYVLPVLEEFESSKAVSYKVKELALPSEAIGGESDTRRGIAFYTDRINIEDIHSYADMKEFFSRKERVWGIVKRKHYEQYRREKVKEVSDPLYQVGKKVVVTNRVKP